MVGGGDLLKSLGSRPWTHFADIAIGDKIVPMVAIGLRLAMECAEGGGNWGPADAIARIGVYVLFMHDLVGTSSIQIVGGHGGV